MPYVSLKTLLQQQTPGAYRPISLLSTIGKVIETVIGRRIADAAETHSLLPQLQMGNRPDRSTELAVKVVVDAVHTAWKHGAVASLLQLDIKGAFDTVNHVRLLDTLRSMGCPMWVVRWTKSFLTGREARLRFDGGESAPIQINAGVPQGSPLSPILFLLYIASLYERLQAQTGLLVVGFADDTNLMAFGNSALSTSRQLEAAWKIWEEWSLPLKRTSSCTLRRAHVAPATSLRLGSTMIQPVVKARFLGVWLDRKLRWKGQLQAIKTKFMTQKYALTRLAASTWGCSLARAREIYTKVIRGAIAYGAGVWHLPGGLKPKGIPRNLLTTQSQCLRTVSGAYRATPVRNLETETATPPLDLYLNRRVAEFEQRLGRSGKDDLIRSACRAVATRLRQRRNCRRPAQEASLEHGQGRTQ